MKNTTFRRSEFKMDDEFNLMDEIDEMDFIKKEFKENNINDSGLLFDEDELMEQQFRILPGVLEDQQMSIDENELDILPNISADAVSFENAQLPDYFELLLNSQENPLLPNISNNSQQLQTTFLMSDLLNEEPYVPEYEEYATKPLVKTTTAAVINPILTNDNSYQNNVLKKRPANIKDELPIKKPKFWLDLSKPTPINDTLNTPDIVSLIDKLAEENANENFPKNSHVDVLHDLFNTENSMHSIDNSINMDESPQTPLSSYSHSHNTSCSDYTLTEPDSPALSTSSHQAPSKNTNSNKKKRGRPAKVHSDRPNPMLLQQLTECERKRLEDRAKNNEASRLSRQKNKKRELEEIEEENFLHQRHEELKTQLAETERVVRKLKQALQQKYLET